MQGYLRYVDRDVKDKPQCSTCMPSIVICCHDDNRPRSFRKCIWKLRHRKIFGNHAVDRQKDGDGRTSWSVFVIACAASFFLCLFQCICICLWLHLKLIRLDSLRSFNVAPMKCPHPMQIQFDFITRWQRSGVRELTSRKREGEGLHVWFCCSL